MTADRVSGLGPLGRRLLVAFCLVAVASVLMVTVAALIGSERGIAASTEAGRDQVTQDVAGAAALAYADADGWANADLAPAIAVADGVGARLQIHDADGVFVGGSEQPGNGRGPGNVGRGAYEATIVVDGDTVGIARLGFGRSGEETGRGIAWTWILIAAAAALVLAVAVSWVVARQITRPIHRLTRASAAFAAGDREARANINAPDEIGELARTFDAAADAIAKAEQVRRNLSADVAHELRTPLTALLIGLEELRDGLVPADEQMLTRLHDQAARLNRIVNDLAALSAAEAPGPSMRTMPIDLTEVVTRTVSGHAAQLRAAGLDVTTELDGPLPVFADADRLAQVIGNLLSNAARYCRPGDRVVVRTCAQAGECVLEIADTGPGISPADLPHIFDRFWRGSQASAVAGSGIGLAVARALVEAQGGMITAASDGHSGTTFTVRMPRATTPR